MKLVVKTVTGTSFNVEVDQSAKVGDVKEKIQETQGDAFRKENLMVIHKGKVLKDPDALAAAGIVEDSFVVVMVSKAGPAAATPPEPAKPTTAGETSMPAPAPAPAATQERAPPAAPAPAPVAATNTEDAMDTETAPPSTPVEEPVAAAAGGDESQYGQAASNFAIGSALQNSINQICEMGFPRDQVERAMRSAFNNPDRAVEYLMNGIPEMPAQPAAGQNAPQQQQQPQQPAPPTGPNTQPLDMFGGGAVGGAPAAGAPGAGAAAVGPPGARPLDFLRNSPQFHALRQMVAQNPHILEPMLQELGKSNPDLFRQINDNQQDFLRLLTEEQQGGEVAEAAQGLMQLHEGAAPVEDIEVSPEDEAAIDRLEALGFDRTLCIEAFFICDKDEDLAANYLLEHGNDL
ncbi:hypothetical protein BSKO_05554 [Bryopsis sp. KO-2023]|nr:hypothetical protein BSKO_05554 [Bryopsis sp. KO-2023]